MQCPVFAGCTLFPCWLPGWLRPFARHKRVSLWGFARPSGGVLMQVSCVCVWTVVKKKEEGGGSVWVLFLDTPVEQLISYWRAGIIGVPHPWRAYPFAGQKKYSFDPFLKGKKINKNCPAPLSILARQEWGEAPYSERPGGRIIFLLTATHY